MTTTKLRIMEAEGILHSESLQSKYPTVYSNHKWRVSGYRMALEDLWPIVEAAAKISKFYTFGATSREELVAQGYLRDALAVVEVVPDAS